MGPQNECDASAVDHFGREPFEHALGRPRFHLAAAQAFEATPLHLLLRRSGREDFRKPPQRFLGKPGLRYGMNASATSACGLKRSRTRDSPSCRTASAIVFTQWIWTTTGDGMIACTLVSIEGRRPLALSCASTKSIAAAARGSPSAMALRRGSRRTRRHDVLRERVGEPSSRRLDPHDAVSFDRRVAAGALRPQGIGAERGGQLPQRVKLTVIDMRGSHQTGCGVSI